MRAAAAARRQQESIELTALEPLHPADEAGAERLPRGSTSSSMPPPSPRPARPLRPPPSPRWTSPPPFQSTASGRASLSTPPGQLTRMGLARPPSARWTPAPPFSSLLLNAGPGTGASATPRPYSTHSLMSVGEEDLLSVPPAASGHVRATSSHPSGLAAASTAQAAGDEGRPPGSALRRHEPLSDVLQAHELRPTSFGRLAAPIRTPTLPFDHPH